MKKYLLLTFSVLLYSIGNGQTSLAYEAQDWKKGEITQEQSDLIFENSKIFPNNTQIAIALIRNGVTKFYGIKRVNDSIQTVVNNKNVFEIGSITKVFTSTLLANFVIKNKIKLDENINQYLKFPLKDNQKITFRELANHTSGLPRMPSNLNLSLANPDNPYEKYGEKELKEYLSQELELSTTTKNKFNYSNLGAGLLGYTLSQIAEKSYQELVRENIFSKYNMFNTTTERQCIEPLLVKGQNPEGEFAPNWDSGVLLGAGAILSTVNDLSKFIIAQFDNVNKELELTRIKTFTINERMDIGLGWHIMKRQSGENWFSHNGGTGGYRSSMTIDTINKNGIIILSNVSAFNPNSRNIDKLCFELLETLKTK